MTPQGRAMKEVCIQFGDGKTLPFTPCKRGYLPMKGEKEIKEVENASGKQQQQKRQKQNNEIIHMVACSFHEKLRRKRLQKENNILRWGEVNVNELFWSNSSSSSSSSSQQQKDDVNNVK